MTDVDPVGETGGFDVCARLGGPLFVDVDADAALRAGADGSNRDAGIPTARLVDDVGRSDLRQPRHLFGDVLWRGHVDDLHAIVGLVLGQVHRDRFAGGEAD